MRLTKARPWTNPPSLNQDPFDKPGPLVNVQLWQTFMGEPIKNLAMDSSWESHVMWSFGSTFFLPLLALSRPYSWGATLNDIILYILSIPPPLQPETGAVRVSHVTKWSSTARLWANRPRAHGHCSKPRHDLLETELLNCCSASAATPLAAHLRHSSFL